MPIILELVDFLKNPKAPSAENNTEVSKTSLQKSWEILRIWGLQMFLAGIASIILSSILFFAQKTDDHELTSVILQEEVLTIFFLVVIYAPIFEELAFRLYLKFSPARLAVGLGLMSSFLINFLISFLNFDIEKFVTESDNVLERAVFVLALNLSFVILPIIIFYLFLKIRKIGEIVEGFYNQKYGYIFYSSILIFGALHLGNFNNWEEVLILAPFLFLPQIIAGLSLGYIRVKYGFKWAVLVHALTNFSAVVAVLIPKLGSDKLQELLVKSSQGETLDSSEMMNNLNPLDISLLAVTNLYFIGLLILIFVLNSILFYEYYIFRKKKKVLEV